MANLIGQSLGRYHILEQLGEGGMATVYKAYDTRLEREVAVKIIRRNAFPPDQLDRILKRFEREAKSLARLSQPNILKVLDYGEHEGSPYLVLEYLSGGTLKESLKGKPMDWQDAVRTLIPISRALEYAHEQKIIHRDVKPANILMTQKGLPLLSDFGIAKILELEDGQTLTGTGMGVGTPEYMSPEQGLGKEVDGRADIYSMGIIFYELVTGRKPYTADTPMAVVFKHISDPLPRPRQFMPDLPDAVERVLLKALAKDPKDRYPDAGAFATAMEYLLMGTGQNPVSTPSLIKSTEPNLETQDIYIQEGTNSTRSKTGTATEASRKTRTTQTINPPSTSLPKKIVWWPWAVGGIGLVLAVITFSNSNSFAPAATEAPAPIATEAQVATVIPSDGSSMIGKDGMTLLYVPEGDFMMGGDTYDNGKPAHTVNLDAFWIDQTEVTNKQYAACVSSEGCTPPSNTSSYTNNSYYGNTQFDNYPVVYVNWNKAKAYCEWAGRRLPTEAEWEKAARGTDGRKYPWGEIEPNAELANYNMFVGDTTPVGKYPDGKSYYGAYDMAGNVWEWVNDWYGETYYQGSPRANPLGPGSGTSRVLRGGSWFIYRYDVRSSNRSKNDPSNTYSFIGFRCAGGISP